MTNKQLYEIIYSKYGVVTRARGGFLYTKKGTRLTDLFLENGRAVLGWDGKNAFTFFKNMLNKGLTGGFICQEENCSRIEKAVSALLESDRRVLFFSSKGAALKAAVQISQASTAVYRPWLTAPVNWKDTDCVIITPPLAWCDNFYILAVKSEKIQSSDFDQDAFQTTVIPFAQQAAVTRAVYNLIAELPLRTEKDWFVYDPVLTKYWTRKGPYLFPKISENKYDDFVRHCLDCGIVINPCYNEPSIVPFGADLGVFGKLKNNPFEIN